MKELLKELGYTENDFSAEHLEYIRWGLKRNFTIEQIRLYAIPDLTPRQISSVISKLLGQNNKNIPDEPE